MMKKEKVIIYDLIGGKDAVSSADGDVLFKIISKALKEGIEVTLDFMNVEIITSTFLNVAIGQLYNKYDSSLLKEYLKLENIDNGDLETLKRVVERAKQYFKDKKNMDDVIDETLNG